MKIFVIGKPIKHSLSPDIHNFWLKSRGKKVIYEKKECHVDGIKKLISSMKKNQILGFNVTLPHKQIMKNYLEAFDASVIDSGAVNTVYKDNEKITGANTDGIGFVSTLREDLNYKIGKKNIFIVGAGGASRGIIFELIKEKPTKIILTNRNIQKAIEIKEKIELISNTEIKIQHWQDKVIEKNVSLIINTTSYGLNKNETLSFDMSLLNKNTVVYDIIYNPLETNFIKIAKKKGFKTFNGIDMLVRQASFSFEKWFGEKLNCSEVKNAKEIIINILK